MTTIVFIASLIAVCAMLGSKIFEIKVRKIEKLSELFMKGDHKIHQSIEWALSKYAWYRKVALIFVFDFLPAYAYEMTCRLKDFIAKRYYSMGDQFRGRRVLRNNGSVSSFLQNITDGGTDISNL